MRRRGGKQIAHAGAQQADKTSRTERTRDYPIPCSCGEPLNAKGSCARGTYPPLQSACLKHPSLLGARGDSHPLTGRFCLRRIRALVWLRSARLARLLFPLPAALETPAHSVDSSAYRRRSASRVHTTPCKTRCIQHRAKQ